MPQVTLTDVPAKKFTESTIAEMWRHVLKGKTNWAIIMLATKIVREGAPEKHWVAEVRAIYEWFKKNIRYTKDPANVELIENPLMVLGQRRAGDCDSVVSLAALLGAVGYITKFRTIRADPTRPDEWSHVYLMAFIPRSPQENWSGGWTPLDFTVKTKPFGWEPKGFVAKDWPEPDYG